MTEERWHNFAKEKPSEDMEGRNFIVSNGHYEKIATWCGYWENEPFMGDRLCDEVVRWKGYLTPEEEKANEATRTEPKPMKELKRHSVRGVKYNGEEICGGFAYYDADDVDALLAKKDAAIAELKARIQLDDDEMAGFLDLEEECGGGDLRNYIAELKADNESLKYEKRKMYTKMQHDTIVDALCREHRQQLRSTRRALWLTRANMARGLAEMCEHQFDCCGVSRSRFLVGYDKKSKPKRMTTTEWGELWRKIEQKCRTKAEEYK